MRDKTEKNATVKKGLERQKRAKVWIKENLLPEGYDMKDYHDPYGPVDWVVTKNGKVIGYLEFKTREFSMWKFQCSFNFQLEQEKVEFARTVPSHLFTLAIIMTQDGKWMRVDLRHPSKENVLDERCHGGKDKGILARWTPSKYQKVEDAPEGLVDTVWEVK